VPALVSALDFRLASKRGQILIRRESAMPKQNVICRALPPSQNIRSPKEKNSYSRRRVAAGQNNQNWPAGCLCSGSPSASKDRCHRQVCEITNYVLAMLPYLPASHQVRHVSLDTKKLGCLVERPRNPLVRQRSGPPTPTPSAFRGVVAYWDCASQDEFTAKFTLVLFFRKISEYGRFAEYIRCEMR